MAGAGELFGWWAAGLLGCWFGSWFCWAVGLEVSGLFDCWVPLLFGTRAFATGWAVVAYCCVELASCFAGAVVGLLGCWAGLLGQCCGLVELLGMVFKLLGRWVGAGDGQGRVV